MRNRSLLIGLLILLVGLVLVFTIFITNSSRPDAGSGRTDLDAVAAGAPEARPDALPGTD